MNRNIQRSTENLHRAAAVLCLLCLISIAVAADDAPSEDVRRGRFEVTYSPSQLFAAETVAGMADVIDPDEEITWKMYVPENYDDSKPAGLMVYVSPTTTGSMPRSWRSVISDKNIIWISANDSGNTIGTARRILLTMLGPQIAAKLYEIDTDRVYLSGFSGGGKIASIVAVAFANLFDGAIYIGGAEHWTEHPPKMFDEIKLNRYVFVTGDADFNRELTQRVYSKYRNAGLENIKMMTISGMGHTTPNKRHFKRAVNFLDDRT